MSTLTITLNTGDSDAMATFGSMEVHDVLLSLARKVESHLIEPGTDLPVRDANGARVGTIVWTE